MVIQFPHYRLFTKNGVNQLRSNDFQSKDEADREIKKTERKKSESFAVKLRKFKETFIRKTKNFKVF